MPPIRLKSPAKVNVYLKIVNKRSDGFHNLKTIFEKIDLSDEIILRQTNDGKIKITCDHPDVPTGPKNLVYKVAKILQDRHSVKWGVAIHINKRIPVAAGLGGGSSNGATVIKGLNKLWKLNLSQREMLDIAQRIGSDVAFFLYNYSWALGTNRGEKIKRINLNTKLHHVLVIPRLKLYSGEVYNNLNWPSTKMLTKKSDNVNILTHNLRKNNIRAIDSLFENDLEKSVVELSPSLLALKQKLKSLNLKGVMVSGSGPCVFGTAETLKQAKEVQKVLLRRYSRVFAVSTD